MFGPWMPRCRTLVPRNRRLQDTYLRRYGAQNSDPDLMIPLPARTGYNSRQRSWITGRCRSSVTNQSLARSIDRSIDRPINRFALSHAFCSRRSSAHSSSGLHAPSLARREREREKFRCGTRVCPEVVRGVLVPPSRCLCCVSVAFWASYRLLSTMNCECYLVCVLFCVSLSLFPDPLNWRGLKERVRVILRFASIYVSMCLKDAGKYKEKNKHNCFYKQFILFDFILGGSG